MLKLGALRKTKVWKEVYFSQQVIHSLKVIKCLDKYCWCRTACVLKKLNKKQLLSHGQNIIFRMILDLFWLLCSCASSMADFLFLPLTAPAGQHSGGSPGLCPAAAGMSSYAWTGHENRHRDWIPAWGGHAGNAEETGTTPDNRCESCRCCWFLLMWWWFQTVFDLFIFVFFFLNICSFFYIYFFIFVIGDCFKQYMSGSFCFKQYISYVWGDCLKQYMACFYWWLFQTVYMWLVHVFVGDCFKQHMACSIFCLSLMD